MTTSLEEQLYRVNLEEQLRRYKLWVDDLQSGSYVNCGYCGYRYGPCQDRPVAMADLLKQHVERCQEHPLFKLRKIAAAAYDALRSYEFGNSATELAKECADALGVELGVKPGETASARFR